MTTRVHEDWLLTPERIAVHLPTMTGVAADLHLGYHLSRRRSGDAVPLPRLEDELAPLGAAAKQYDFHRLIVAGDLVERAGDLVAKFVDWLSAEKIDFAGIVPGNHDRHALKLELPWHPEGMELGDWHIVHGDNPPGEGKIVCGHWHPSLFVKGRKRPAYLVGPRQLILPAFTQEAAGASVRSDTRWAGWQCYPIVGKAVEPGKFLSRFSPQRHREHREEKFEN